MKCNKDFQHFASVNGKLELNFQLILLELLTIKFLSDLKNLLKDQGNYYIYEEINVVKEPTLEPVHSLAIHCLETSLSDNKKLAERIESILKDKSIVSERCVSSGHYIIPIQVDEKGYICIHKQQ